MKIEKPPDKKAQSSVENFAPWFDKNISKQIIDYNDPTFVSKQFTKVDNNIHTEIFYTTKLANINYKPNQEKDVKKDALKLLDKYLDNIHENPAKKSTKKEANRLSKTPAQKLQQEKELKTKFYRDLNEIGTVIKTTKHIIHFNQKQKEILYTWIAECRKLYNKCVDKLNTNKKYFNNGFKAIKAEFLGSVYGKIDKPAPYDVLSQIIRDFCSNLKAAFTNKQKGNIKRFRMNKILATATNYSLYIPLKSIQDHGIFTTKLGKVDNFPKLNTTHDCRLFYNYHLDTFTLLIPTTFHCKPIEKREAICAIDPGESKFISFYGLQSHGYIGKGIRVPLLKLRNKISRYQKVLDKNINRKNNKLKNRKQLRKKIRKLYKKTKCIVKELHNQSANYLCKNYDKILIPKFETQKMISSKKKFKEYKMEFINKGETTIEKNKNARKFTKICRLSKNVKYVLNQLSHFSFRQHLANKAKEHGCLLKVVTEEYTSQACTKCGMLSKTYNNRIKTCGSCKYEIDRDINGARNILIKNINEFPKLKCKATKPMVSTNH